MYDVSFYWIDSGLFQFFYNLKFSFFIKLTRKYTATVGNIEQTVSTPLTIPHYNWILDFHDINDWNWHIAIIITSMCFTWFQRIQYHTNHRMRRMTCVRRRNFYISTHDTTIYTRTFLLHLTHCNGKIRIRFVKMYNILYYTFRCLELKNWNLYFP